MKLSTFLIVLLVGILTITSVFFYANYRIVKTEYHEYRDGIFTRAYESLLSDLTAYLRNEDEAVASRVVARLAELPLSDGEVETARKLASDMAAGAYDHEARSRALSYSESLLRYLSGHRTRAYTQSWRAAGMGLPAYPEASRPTAAQPEEVDLDALRREKAMRLLENKSLVTYRREENGETLYGYRTASSYAEMTEEGTLRRMLRSVGEGDAFLSEEACREAAEAFLAEQYGVAYALTASESSDRGYRFTFRSGKSEAVVGVDTGTGKVDSLFVE
ncbi:MAG: hypothetical protein E7630_06230 [Ruminococcaceae bacterium]|nr:hypothetical protein [Oscillospiraceae bacterium]